MNFIIDDYNALRSALCEMCRAFSDERLSDDTVFHSKLVANELLSNVLQHGGGRAFFSVERLGDEIRICVKDSNEYRPPVKSVCADVLEESGRGLYLVDAYCIRRDYTEREGIRVYLKIERKKNFADPSKPN